MLVVLANPQVSQGRLPLVYASFALAFVIGMAGAIRGAQVMAVK
jgi:hypothetical protein